MVIQISCPHLVAGDAQLSPDYTRMKTSLSWVPEWNGATCLLPYTLFTFPSLGTFYSSSSRKVPLKTCCFTALDIIFSLVQAPCSVQVGQGPFGMPFMLPLLKSYSFSLFFSFSECIGCKGKGNTRTSERLLSPACDGKKALDHCSVVLNHPNKNSEDF